MDDQAVAFRCLIRATFTAPATGDDIANIVTDEIPDGAQCFVLENRQLYRFKKHSTLTAAAGVVISPNCGRGRWVKEGPVSGTEAVSVAASDENTYNSGSWEQPDTNLFTKLFGSDTYWTLTASGCVLTYNGPPAEYLVTLSATLSHPELDIVVHQVVSLTNDVTGTQDAFEQGSEFCSLATNSMSITCQRVVTLEPGLNIRPKFRTEGGESVTTIERLTLTAIPIP